MRRAREDAKRLTRLEVSALHEDDGPMYPKARRRMSDILEERGIQVVGYENIVEAAGSTSYIACSRKVRIDILAVHRVIDGATTPEEPDGDPAVGPMPPTPPVGLVGRLIAWTRDLRRRTNEDETNDDGPATRP